MLAEPVMVVPPAPPMYQIWAALVDGFSRPVGDAVVVEVGGGHHAAGDGDAAAAARGDVGGASGEWGDLILDGDDASAQADVFLTEGWGLSG